MVKLSWSDEGHIFQSVFATKVSVSENQNIIVEREVESWETAGQYLDVSTSGLMLFLFFDVMQRTRAVQ